jgi:hypothetical protein
MSNGNGEDLGEDEHLRAPLLLHSLTELSEIILPCLEIAGARSVVEVGAEEGTFTRQLVGWAEEHDGTVYCVEPAPTPVLREMCEASDAVVLVEQFSPRALEELDRADVYVVDGDHNHYTVKRELEAIEAKSAGGGLDALVMLQDIGWPWGRRDLYYAPDSLPSGAVHPYTYDRGVTLDCSGVGEGGFRGEGEFAVALEEGGPANGMLTAVEDFLEPREELVLARIASVFGLGVLYPASALYQEKIAAFLSPFDESPLLQRLEENRLRLYLKVIELQDDSTAMRRDLEGLQLRNRDVDTENRALWARIAELESRSESMEAEVVNLLNSRAFAVGERLSTVTRRRGKGPGLSRQRLQNALDGKAQG